MVRHKASLVHIRLPAAVHQKLKVTCATRGETIQAFVERAIASALSANGRASNSERENDLAQSQGWDQDPGHIAESIITQMEGGPVGGHGLTLGDSAVVDVAGLPDKEADALEHLSGMDWTFESAETREHAHGIHPYPAKFIPQIPRELISALHPGDGSATLDPFCGSGTTLLESVRQGFPAVGVDVNPLAVLIARVKTTPLDQPLDGVIDEVLAAAAEQLTESPSPELPEIPRLDHWFQANVAGAVAALVQAVNGLSTDEAMRDALRVALSSILVRVSNQESDVRYAAIEKPVDESDVLRLFERSARQVSRRLTEAYSLPLFPELRTARATVVQRDTRTLADNLPAWNVGLIVTSPPYPNAYEYWLYHKYRMYWLGMDPIAARRDEIGARPYYSQKNGLTADDFAEDLAKGFLAFRELLPEGRYACFLIGNSRIRGTYVDNAALLRGVAESSGFRLRASLPRRIPSTRKSFNPAIGSIRAEKLLVFRRE